MTDVLMCIFMVLLSAVIGLITNYLAIKMLFHPYNEHKLFGKIKVPFTPGIIPRNRHRIAVSLADTMNETGFTDEGVKEEIRKSIANIDFIGMIFENKSIDEILGDYSNLTKEEIANKLSDLIVLKFIEGNYSQKIVDKLYQSIKPKLGFFGGMVGGLISGLEEQINNFIEEYGKEEIKKEIINELNKVFMDDINITVSKLLNGSNEIIMNISSKYIEKVAPKVIENIDFKGLMVRQIDKLDIKEFEKMLLKVINKELKAITYLGGLLGGLLGLINIIFVLFM